MSSIEAVRALGRAHSNWGRWGPDDQLGTLNLITADAIQRAASRVRRGRAMSLAVAFDEHGPQTGAGGRFNPIHLMVRDGGDSATGALVRDFQGGVERHHHSTDDIVIMPLQAGTQWDSLAHVLDDGRMYNGFEATWVSSRGAMRNDVATARDKIVGRGILLDVPRWRGRDWLAAGEAITAADLEACARDQGCSVETGDILLVRTGRMAQVRAEGNWNGFTNVRTGSPGLSLDCVGWLHDNQIGALASDNVAVEVQPAESSGVPLPLHIVCIVYLGMMLGEIFDLEELAQDCAADGVYEFLFVAPPLPFTHAVGSPVNPIAIK